MRLSVKEAERLGLMSRIRDQGPKKAAPARRPARGRIAVATEPRLDGEVSFFAPVRPQTKQRARTFLPMPEIISAFVASRGRKETFIGMLSEIKHQSFTPKDTKDTETAIARAAAAAMAGRAPCADPMVVSLVFVLDGDPSFWPTAHNDGDLDNFTKLALDAMNRIVFEDDRLVVHKVKWKICGKEPGVAITARPADLRDIESIVHLVPGFSTHFLNSRLP